MFIYVVNNRVYLYYDSAKRANFFGISQEIDFILEDNKLKHGKYIPGVKIPIKSKQSFKNNKDTILVLAWNFFNEIVNNNKDLSEKFINIKDLEN